MGEKSQIEWTDATWNPWVGCHRLSPACAHCYMFRDRERYGQNPDVVLRTSEHTFKSPIRWKQPKRIFTCSWSDFFIEESDPWRSDAWQVILDAPQHTYQILTKRPERIANVIDRAMITEQNIWTGVSVENRRFYSRIDALRKVSPNLIFLSIEPLLGRMPDLPLEDVKWVIVGGESGPNYRPLNLDWVREIRDRCLVAGVSFFFKQYSAFNPATKDRLLDGREWNEFPTFAAAARRSGTV